MAITPLPALDRTSPTFKADVDLFFASQVPGFAAEANALQVDVSAKQSTAAGNANAAATSASNAATSATNAATSASNAAASSASAADSAGEAASSEYNASISAANAKSHADRLIAPSPTAPATRGDGTPLQIGDRYVNSGNQTEYIYKSSGWVANDSLEAIAEIKDATDPAKGAALVGFRQTGSGAVARTVRDKIGEVLSTQDYPSLSVSLIEAKSMGAVVEARSSLTVKIPTDSPNLQSVFDSLYPVSSQIKITVLIEAGYVLGESLALENGDYSGFTITSQDPAVLVSSLFQRVPLFLGINAQMPTLACLIDANGYGEDGIKLDANSKMTIEAGCGVKRAYSTGLLVQNGSVASARGSNFSYAARNGSTGAGITAWGGFVDATDADVTFSGYYGAQSAHGGILTFERGNADDCIRYGVRGSDRGSIDFSEGKASRCGVYGIYAFQNSSINAPGATAEGCGSINVVATNASTINFRSGKGSGATKTSPSESNYGHNIFATGASVIDVFNAVLTGAADSGIWCEGASTVNAGGTDTSGSVINGYKCTQNGVISAPLGKANNCGTGFYADTGGRINAMQAQATGCINAAVVADQGSDISIPKATLTGAVNYGARVLNGARLNLSESNCQKGAVGDVTDIQCFSGSIINAYLSTGGMNRTANTLTAQGVILK